MRQCKTPQEELWSGEFGDNYIERNNNENMIAANRFLFSKILRVTQKIQSALEFGANIGLNLAALHSLFPNAELSGIEINKKAYERLNSLGYVKAYHISAMDFNIDYQRDISFTKGVLIHINPDMLSTMYELLYQSSKRYICICEYYSPNPVEIEYRGVSSALFKRDFTGELMDNYPDLQLLDYGFAYHRDNNAPADDINWFLLEKKGIIV